MSWSDLLAEARAATLQIGFPGRARAAGDDIAGAEYVTLDNGHPVQRHADGSLTAVVSGRAVMPSEARPAPLAWVNSVNIQVDKAADAVRIGISLGDDPEVFFTMEAVRDGDGELWLRVPHPERDRQPGKLLGGRLGQPGTYWVKAIGKPTPGRESLGT